MADFYMDTDAGSDANNGTTWALAKLTLEGLLAVMLAGDNGFVQGLTADTAAIDRTYASPGTVINPCKITGVADGTTNEPPLLSDLAVTLPVISTTGTAADNIFTGSSTYINIDFITGDRTSCAAGTNTMFIGCDLDFVDRWTVFEDAVVTFINSVHTPLASTGSVRSSFNSLVEYRGGSFTFSAAATLTHATSDGDTKFIGVDLSGLTSPIQGTTSAGRVVVKNCKMPASFTLMSSVPTDARASVTVIASDDTNSIAATASIQDYQDEAVYGTVEAEFTVVRTGGANDGASGAFSYAMTARANSTLESSGAALKSPWVSLWIEAGSQTLTVFIANSSASTDYNEDEVWIEFYTPDSADTAQHEQNFDPANARLFASSTAITDDTGSTWGTGGNNHQKLSVSVTPGFEGPAYARLHLAKRQATPDTLYLDPLIEIT